MTEPVLPPWAMIAHLGLVLKLDEAQCEKIGEVVSQWSTTMFDCAALFARCESPIERLFLLAPFLQNCTATEPRQDHGWMVCNLPNGRRIAVYLQQEICDFADDKADVVARADFHFCLQSEDRAEPVSVFVETDGHEFHEKTREQVARDKARDRKIARLGHRILRFSGSEVYASPGKCFNEVIETLLAIEAQEADVVARQIWCAHRDGFAEGYARRGESLAVLADQLLGTESTSGVTALLERHGERVGAQVRMLLPKSATEDLKAALDLRAERIAAANSEKACTQESP